ncbi:GNAT family N-acetyltransferase [Roseibium sp.]|uniref:GNAT family N-acetyltransferase n=1 Tax=Roseibium sp. TaxID=1936156 RepID=UPI003A988247
MSERNLDSLGRRDAEGQCVPSGQTGGSIDIVSEIPAHVGAREALLDRSFGPDRFTKTSERLREGRLPAFAFTALNEDEELVGTVRLWNVEDGNGWGALLLGPLAVETECRSQQVGGRLMRHALNQAAMAGHGAVILVGDYAYYQRFGFARGLLEDVTMPGTLERDRFLAIELQEGYLSGFAGCLVATGEPDLATARGRKASRPLYKRVA